MVYLEKLFNVKNKIAVVTGGLGVIGTQQCIALISAGAKVAVFDIKNPNKNHPLKKYGRQGIEFFRINIAKTNEVKKGLSKIEKNWGTPSILLNNAAIDFPPDKTKKETFENYPLDKWNAVVEVNLTGMLVCCQIIGGEMAKNNKGSIINVSSTYGLLSPDQRVYDNFIKPVSYSVTKSGVLNLTRYLATYWADKGVRVNTLTPAGVFNNQDKEFVKKYCYRVPMGRMAKSDEYNGAVLFLASDASSYMTGANLIIDGGWTAW
jgi:NAD(P)-dependent dehydrogenase (short-subunit alcohol dehydrogenase family)